MTRKFVDPLRLPLLAGAVAALPSVAAGQDGPSREEITVWGNPLEETVPLELQEYGNRVEIITAEQIQARGFNDVSQALQSMVPGLYVAPKNGAFDYVEVSLQGSRTSDILWLVDGVRISNRLYNSTTPLDTIPAHMIERIEVLKGGQGLYYGTQSVAGVINVVTKSFSEETDGALSLGFDTNGGRHINGYARGSKGPHRFVVYGSSDEAEGYQPFRDSAYQPSATDRQRSYDVTNLGAKYGIDFTEDLGLSLHYQHTEAKLDFAEPAQVARKFNDRDEDILSATFDLALTDNVQTFVKGYYHDWDTLFTETHNDPDDPDRLIPVFDKAFWGFTDYGVNVMTELNLHEGFEYVVGYDYQRYKGRDEVLRISQKTESVNAFFGQVRTTDALIPDTRLAAGVRHNIAKGGDTTTIWNVSGRHDFSSELFLRGTVGTSFRLPDAFELYAIDPCCTLGNPNLVGEESTNFNAALGGRLDVLSGIDWELIGFYREVDNLIQSEEQPDGTRLAVNTDSQVKFKGAEFILTGALTRELSFTFDVTVTEAEPAGSNDQIENVPESHAKLLLDYQPSDLPVGLSASANYVGKVSEADRQIGQYTVMDLAGYWTLDDDGHHRLSFRLENVLDKTYGTSVQTVMPDNPGRSNYQAETLGTPRTFHMEYRLSF